MATEVLSNTVVMLIDDDDGVRLEVSLFMITEIRYELEQYLLVSKSSSKSELL